MTLEKPPGSPSARRRIGRLAVGLTSTCCVVGLILWLTVRDRVPALAPIFYAMPLPFLVGLALVTSLLSRRLKRRPATFVWGGVTLATAAWCIVTTGHWNDRPVRTEETIRILCWNTCRGELGWDGVAGVINEINPDIAGLVEAGEWSEERRAFWKESCPGYRVSLLGGGIVCLSKAPQGEGTAVHLSATGEYRRLEIGQGEKRMTVLIVDTKSDPLMPRMATLEHLAEDAEAIRAPLIVMGDFNTPPDSVHFAAMRRHHCHAFESAGRGYMATWPLPLPVLCLDHIWANDRIRIDGCRHLWTAASDHRPVVADVTVVR